MRYASIFSKLFIMPSGPSSFLTLASTARRVGSLQWILAFATALRSILSKSRKSGQSASLGSSLDVPSAVSNGKVSSPKGLIPYRRRGPPFDNFSPAIRPYNIVVTWEFGFASFHIIIQVKKESRKTRILKFIINRSISKVMMCCEFGTVIEMMSTLYPLGKYKHVT